MCLINRNSPIGITHLCPQAQLHFPESGNEGQCTEMWEAMCSVQLLSCQIFTIFLPFCFLTAVVETKGCFWVAQHQGSFLGEVQEPGTEEFSCPMIQTMDITPACLFPG